MAGVRRLGTTATVIAALCVFAGDSARAADSIYWTNLSSGTISHANLGGGGGGELPLPPGAADLPISLAIDSAKGQILWANRGNQTIGIANLDGTGAHQFDTRGAPVDEPTSLVIDSRTRRLYWANFLNSTIAFANLDGGGGGTVDTTGAPATNPNSIAIDPQGERIYWLSGEGIYSANIGGGGGTPLAVNPAMLSAPVGLAIDPIGRRLFWANGGDNTIGVASLDGKKSGHLDIGAAPIDAPVGVAVDPAADKVYWANYGDGTIAVASLSGGDGHRLETTGVTPSGPVFPTLLRIPEEDGHPTVSGPPQAGSTLSCGARPAPDLVGSLLYRAPQTVSYQWLRNGTLIPGGTQQTIRPQEAGSYRCEVTLANFAGSASASSPEAIAIEASLTLGKVRLNRRAGTAVLGVSAIGAGRIKLTGTAVRRATNTASPRASLRINPTRHTKARLDASGRAKVRVTVRFAPRGGRTIERFKQVILRKSRSGARD